MYLRSRLGHTRYRFDGFEADARCGELRQGSAKILLQDVPFRFLAALLEHPGELRNRDELRREIWPDDVNLDFDGALATAARKVRQALGDSSREPRFIETLPGRGYRFIGDVVAEPEDPVAAVEPEPRAARGRPRLPFWTLGALVLLLGALGWIWWKPAGSRPTTVAMPGRAPSLVVLPAKVFGGAESAFLADAIPDTLSTLLGKMEGLDTKLPPSSAQVDHLHGDVAKVAAAYQADYLVLTTVTVEGDRMLLNVKLAEGPTRKVRWASQYEATRNGYNNLLRDTALSLAAVIRPGTVAPAAEGQPSFDSFVELALREGRYFQRQYQSSKSALDFDRALAAFRKAQSLRPSSALLTAEVARLFQQQYFFTRDPKASLEAERWAARALQMDPRCGRAWAVKCGLQQDSPKADPAALIEYALKAIGYSPDDAGNYLYLGAIAPTFGFQAATGACTVELDPLNTMGYSWSALGLTMIRRADEALPILDRVQRVDATPGFHTWLRFFVLFHAGRTTEARQAYTEVAWPDASRLMGALLRGDEAGGREQALKTVAEWRKAELGSIDWVNRASFYAPLLVRLGMREDALWVLDRCSLTGLPTSYDWLLLDPDMQKLRGDPRYAKALEASRKYALMFLAGADAAKARGEFPRRMESALAELRILLQRG